MNSPVILCDFDNTLTKTDSIKFLLISLFLSDPVNGVKVFTKLKKPIGDQSVLKHQVISTLVKGKTFFQVKKSLFLYRRLVTLSFRHSLIRKLEYKDAKVIIASASPGFALQEVQEIADLIIIATDYEIVDGRYTGKINGDVCFGKEKLERVKKYLSINKIDSVIEAYTDHYSDFPMLSVAQKKYLVNPDKKTQSKATDDFIVLYSSKPSSAL